MTEHDAALVIFSEPGVKEVSSQPRACLTSWCMLPIRCKVRFAGTSRSRPPPAGVRPVPESSAARVGSLCHHFPSPAEYYFDVFQFLSGRRNIQNDS